MLSKGNHAHYEIGMEQILRKSKITYIGTHERRMALLRSGKKLKNFDTIIMAKDTLIVDFKGKLFGYSSAPANRWENWIPTYHAKDLIKWQSIFKTSGCNVIPLLVFVYKLTNVEDREKFKDIYIFEGIAYGVVGIEPQVFLRHAKPRAKNVISVSRKKFQTLVKPLSFYVQTLNFN